VGWPDPFEGIDVAEVLRAAMRAGADWAELFVEERDVQTVRLSGGVVETGSDRDVGAAVRVVSGGTAGLAYTSRLTTAELVKTAKVAAAAVSPTSAAHAGPRALTRSAVKAPQVARMPPSEVSTAAKVQLLRRANEAARSHDAAVREVSAVHVDVTQNVLVANSDGTLARDSRVRTRLTCRVTARRDGRLENGFDGPGIGGGMELYEADPPEHIATRAAERAVHALGGHEPPGGDTTVVLGPGGGGLLLHEACGHGLEADGLSRDSSIYARTRGRRIASRLVTAVDDPSQMTGFGSYGVDDEGRSSTPTVLIQAGVQVGVLSDSATATRLGGLMTANGRRASYAHPPLPRMSNTYIEPGNDHPASVLADVRRGVYVTRLRGGDVNMVTGDFAFNAAEAYLIEGGRLTRPLSAVALIGNAPAALEAVDAVCSDLAFTQALCGKEDQWVPVSYGAPTVRIARLTVAGQG
jgi:TldD protein